MAVSHCIEWSNNPLGSDLRWGIRRRPNGPITNYTTVAKIIRDMNKVTEEGAQLAFTVKLSTLFDAGQFDKDRRFSSLAEAKDEVDYAVKQHFRNMALCVP